MQMRWRNNLIRIKTLLRSIIMGLNGSLEGICLRDWYVGKKNCLFRSSNLLFLTSITDKIFFYKYWFLCDENIHLVFFMHFILTFCPTYEISFHVIDFSIIIATLLATIIVYKYDCPLTLHLLQWWIFWFYIYFCVSSSSIA